MSPSRTIPSTSHARGFTIMELIVAVTLYGLLVAFLIGPIFSRTGTAVSTGIARSQLAAHANAIGEEIHQDFRTAAGSSNMTGPKSNGILVLIQRRIPNAPFLVEHPAGGDRTLFRDVRSDQLLFIRNVGSGSLSQQRPMVPASVSTFDAAATISALHARIWYGHVRRTFPDGTDAPDLGQGDHFSPNHHANRWLLGRQALFFDSNASNLHTHATTADVSANVSGAGNVAFGGATPYGSPRVYHGLADVARIDLGAVIYDLLNGPNGYVAQILDLTYASERLRVNPDLDQDVDVDPNDPIERTIKRFPRFKSWQVAQTHPILMTNVSDFIVEFAADVDGNGNGSIDTNGSDDTIRWYSHFDDDTVQPPTYPPAGYGPYQSVNLPNADAIFIWRHDADDGARPWPHLIRIRYRLHDAQGRLFDSNADTEDSWKDEGGNPATEAPDGVHGVWFEHVVPVNRL